MKATIEISDDLYRKAKAIAALRGRRLRDLVEEGLRLILGNSAKDPTQSNLANLMMSGRGIIESGDPDFGSNPEHFVGFGSDARRDR